MNKSRVLAGLLTLLFASVAVMAADQTVYKGKLNPELSLASRYLQALQPASVEATAKLPQAPLEGEEVFAGGLAGIPVILVVPKTGDKYFYFDVNQDGKFDKSERFTFPENNKTLDLNLPVSAGIFKSAPIKLSYSEYTRGSKLTRGIVYEVANIATGTVDIAGQKTLVQYTFSVAGKKINPTRGKLGVDCNNDGKIEEYNNNVEMFTASKPTPVVFRVGHHYVSTKSADVDTGEIVMEEHPASEYTRIELMVGGVVPDFAYKDLDGKTHRFAELLGKNKYLLLDFWGSW